MKIGVIDVGGGMRGVYAAGVFDYCLDHDIDFDCAIGVSAGGANVLSYTAKQKKRNYEFYCEYSFRKEYMGIENFLKNRNFVNLDYIYSTLSNSDGENPLDYKALSQNKMEWYIVATNAVSGEAVYFDKKDAALDNYDIVKASSCIPFICKPYEINHTLYFDGGLSDPIPYKKAFEKGCDAVEVILTRPVDVPRVAKKDELLASLIKKDYPLASEGLRQRAERYNQCVDELKELEKQKRALIIAPDDTCGVDTLKKDRQALHDFYEKGYADGQKIEQYISMLKKDSQ